MADPITTRWIWQDEFTTQVRGVIVDLDDQLIQWFDEPGCACTDSAHEQSIRDFLENGERQPAPVDVLEEMRTEMTRFLAQLEA